MVTKMTHAYTPMLLLEEEAFHRMVTHLDPSIRHITTSKFTRNLILQKLEKTETDILQCLMVCVVL